MNLLIDLALEYIGKPYHFGGNSGVSSFDCSGLVCELLRSAGVIGKEDYSAQGLLDFICKGALPTSDPKAGALAFYGKSITEVTHVAFHLDKFRVIEAGSGDSTITTLEAAIQKGACIRVRPYKYRKDYLCSISPSYASIGII